MRFPNVPTDIKPSLIQFLRDLSASLEREFRARVPNTQGRAELILVSPGGKVYSVRVDDSGTLSTTLVNE